MKLMLSHLAEYNANSIAFLSGNVNSASAAELFATLQTSTRVMNLMTERVGPRSATIPRSAGITTL